MEFIVATDGSQASRAALEYALEIGGRLDAALTAVHAVDPNVYEQEGGDPIASLSDADRQLVVESIEDSEQRGQNLLADAQEVAAGHDLTIDTQLLYGDPIDAIPRYAEREDADGIFVGHRGLSESHERALGSVAKTLVDRTPIPVTIVR